MINLTLTRKNPQSANSKNFKTLGIYYVYVVCMYAIFYYPNSF